MRFFFKVIPFLLRLFDQLGAVAMPFVWQKMAVRVFDITDNRPIFFWTNQWWVLILRSQRWLTIHVISLNITYVCISLSFSKQFHSVIQRGATVRVPLVCFSNVNIIHLLVYICSTVCCYRSFCRQFFFVVVVFFCCYSCWYCYRCYQLVVRNLFES